MNIVEPPLCDSALVFIGRNSRGQWVAQQKNGLFGGLFVNRCDAVRYALFENGRHPEAVIEIAATIELDMSASTPAPAVASAVASAVTSALAPVALSDQRRVA